MKSKKETEGDLEFSCPSCTTSLPSLPPSLPSQNISSRSQFDMFHNEHFLLCTALFSSHILLCHFPCPLSNLHSSGSDLSNLLAYTGFYNPEITGFWIGKGFRAEEKWGYNLFMVNQVLTRWVGDEEGRAKKAAGRENEKEALTDGAISFQSANHGFISMHLCFFGHFCLLFPP